MPWGDSYAIPAVSGKYLEILLFVMTDTRSAESSVLTKNAAIFLLLGIFES
jgi:hypothetical protein